jgi:flagellar operon protein
LNKINLYHPVLPPTNVQRKEPNQTATKSGLDFKGILQQKLSNEGIKFSSHCIKRLEQNNIQISPEQIDKLNSAVDKAQAKGAKESCIIMDEMAFIVSINNRTVITVVEGSRMKDSVFTNIDSAVIL